MNADHSQNSRRGTFKLLSGYIYGDKALLSRATLFLLLATAADVLGPFLGKVFIDDYLMPRNFDTQALVLLLGGFDRRGQARQGNGRCQNEQYGITNQ